MPKMGFTVFILMISRAPTAHLSRSACVLVWLPGGLSAVSEPLEHFGVAGATFGAGSPRPSALERLSTNFVQQVSRGAVGMAMSLDFQNSEIAKH